MEALSLIELHCDAFASLTLAYTGHNPVSFVGAVERFGRAHPGAPDGWRPQDASRRRLVEQVAPGKSLQVKAKKSPDLRLLQNLLRGDDARR